MVEKAQAIPPMPEIEEYSGYIATGGVGMGASKPYKSSASKEFHIFVSGGGGARPHKVFLSTCTPKSSVAQSPKHAPFSLRKQITIESERQVRQVPKPS